MDEDMIYLDHNATTPVAEDVLKAMLPYFSERFGNASSITHPYGWDAKAGIELATEQLCALLNCNAKELVYTSGATESVNMALKGVFEIYRRKGNHIITGKTEHKAVLDTCQQLEKQGARITRLDCDANGRIDLHQLRREISDQTLIVCLMMVNNETGVMQPMKEIAGIVHDHGSILMSDATQAVGKVPIDTASDRIDLLAFSAHKFYGPKGTGGLYIRRKKPRVILSPLIEGGGHQRGLRSGTLNVPGIAGMGAAADLAAKEMKQNARWIGHLRDRMEKMFLQLPGVHIHGAGADRLYNTINLRFDGVRAEDLINAIKMKVAVATGSACSSAEQKPSHVLRAMGLNESECYASMRISLGRDNTEDQVETAARIICERVKEVRSKRTTGTSETA